MFRYNNPDAMLAMLLAGALYATMRGLERAQTKWLVLAERWSVSASSPK